MKMQVLPASLWVFWLWGLVPGLLAALLLPTGYGWRILVAVIWAGVDWLWQRLRTANITCTLESGCLHVSAGRFFPTQHWVQIAAVTEFSVQSTPLLRKVGACLVLVRTPGSLVVLPGPTRADAWALREELARRQG